MWGHERILFPLNLINIFKKQNINKYSLDYYKILPNRAKLKTTKDDFRNFYDNKFTLWLARILDLYLPLFIKRFFTFSYNYVGIKKS